MLARKENIFYTEYYEYDEDRNLSRVANNYGELTDYYYTSNNLLDYTVDYDFVWDWSHNYPYQSADPDSEITKTPKTKTDYTYNSVGLCTLITTYPVDSNLSKVPGSNQTYESYTYNMTTGSKNFGALISERDELDVYIYYYYDDTDGRLLATVNGSADTGICYVYDDMDNLVGVMPATYVSSSEYSPVTNAESVEYTYNSQNYLSTISTETTVYTFDYDIFGNTTAIDIGDAQIVEYVYNSNNGKLSEIIYSNDFSVKYVYNDVENLAEIHYTDGNGTETKVYEYEYTAKGQLYKFINCLNGRTTAYKYDNNGRVVSYFEYDSDDQYHDFSSEIMYNDKGQLSSVYYNIDHLNGSVTDTAEWSYFHAYKSDGRLDYRTISANGIMGGEYFYYDEFDRVDQKVYTLYPSGNSSSGFENQIDYTFKTNDLNSPKTSSRIESYKSTINDETSLTYTYTYDQNGNITKINYSTGKEIRYVYDDLGQLIREDNSILSNTYIYTYDDAGNITSKKTYSLTSAGSTPFYLKETDTYTYGDIDWGDKLTAYNGVTITYDGIGNPLSYNNGSSYTFSWYGRDLDSVVYNGKTMSFSYNDEGVRTSKTVNGVTTTYYVEGSKVIAEETNGNVIIYIYDSDGIPLGMQYHSMYYSEDSWDIYWYERNLQGDIVAVYSSSGIKLISYSYDAWGNFTTAYHNTGENSTAVKNPFKYRGYYYDSDLNLYYLNTRYYDPVIGRFISPDSEATITATLNALTDKNLYAYCDNNPVMRTDNGGMFWDTFFDVVSLAVSIVDVIQNPSDPWAWAGLVGDAVDVLVPGLSGVGETTKALKVANKVDDVVDAVDDVHDTAKAVDNGIDTYKNLKKTTKGSNLEVHHIVEKRFAGDLNIKEGDMLSIALTHDDHVVFTNKWRNKIAYGTGAHSKKEIWDAAQKVYQYRPDLLKAAKKTIFGG